MNNKYSVACITLVRDKYKINIRPIRFENSIRSQKNDSQLPIVKPVSGWRPK